MFCLLTPGFFLQLQSAEFTSTDSEKGRTGRLCFLDHASFRHAHTTPIEPTGFVLFFFFLDLTKLTVPCKAFHTQHKPECENNPQGVSSTLTEFISVRLVTGQPRLGVNSTPWVLVSTLRGFA